jgi:hypothetical protein
MVDAMILLAFFLVKMDGYFSGCRIEIYLSFDMATKL